MPDVLAELGVQQRFLTFVIGQQRYALPAEEVAEVIRLPPVARLPRGPRALMGLANLRGSVVPVVSLPTMLGHPQAAANGSTRAIILSGAQTAALVVDAVEDLLSPEADQIDARQAELTAEPGEHLAGVFPIPATDFVARILDVEKMLSDQFGNRAAGYSRVASAGRLSNVLRDDAQEETPRLVLITFEVAGQEYALPLASVREVVAAPIAIAQVPHAEAVLLGVVAHRGNLLPLLSLAALLGFASGDGSARRAKVIVALVSGIAVGLVADRMRAIISADPELVEPSPPMLAARAGGEARIASMYRGEGGRRLISILAPEGLFREDVMRRLRDSPEMANHVTATERGDQVETAQFVVFRLGTEFFGLPIGAVDEIVRVPDRISRLPNAPEFLEGVVNLRGDVLPVIDQRKRFGLPANGSLARERLVVVHSDRHRAGLIVDAVSEVLHSSPDAIEPAPQLIADTNRLVSGVINLPDREQMILLLEADELLSEAEHELLEGLAITDQA